MSMFGGGALGAAASIFISIGVNSDAAKKGLAAASSHMAGFKGQTDAWSKAVTGAFRGPLDAFGQIGDAADGMKSVMGAVAGLAQTLFQGAARNEQYAVSFEVMMGSAEKATDHINALKDFATTTPFTLPGIVEASKQLEVMGGATLNSMENMRLVGDVASATGADIRAVATSFARMYDSMANGTPLGEVIMRLGEMGALSGESRRAIQGLAADVASGSVTMEEAWASVGGEFERFAGMTSKQSLTMSGLWSTFTDTIDDSFAQIGTKLMPMVKPVMVGMIDLVGQLAKAGLYLADNLQMVVPVIVSLLIPAVAIATMWFLKMAVAVLGATWPFLAAAGAILLVLKILEKFGISTEDIFGALIELVEGVARGFGVFVQIVQDVIGGVTSLMDSFGFLIPPLKIVQMGLGALGDAFGFLMEEAKTSTGMTASAVAFMASAVKDDLAELTPSLRDISNAAFAELALAADKKGREAETNVRNSLRSILDAVKGARDVLGGAATEAAAALYDPAILKADIALTKMALNDKALLAQIQSGTRAERLEGQKRVAELTQTLIEQNTAYTTYGTLAQQITKTQALLTTTGWVKMLKNATPEQAAAILLWKKSLKDQLATMEDVANKGGVAVGRETAEGIEEGLPEDKVMYEWGKGAARSFGDGMADQQHWLTEAAKEFMSGARGQMEFTSPAKEGPWRNVDKWGERAGQTFADSLASANSYLSTRTGDFMSGGLGLAGSQPVKAPGRGGGGMAPPPGGGLIVNMEFNSAVPYTPGEMEQLGRRVGPAVYEYLRQRGLAIS